MNSNYDAKLSVILVTYNHEPYIERSLRSLFNQTIVDELHVVWVDDCSTDATVRRGEHAISTHRFKNIDRLHYKTNRYQRGASIRLDVWELLKGEFIALMDGDDFLISPAKYINQITLMEQVADIGVSFTRSQGIEAERAVMGRLWGDLGNNIGIVPFGAVIRGDGGLIPTASMVLRKNQFDNAPIWFWQHQPAADYMFQVLGAFQNGAIYMPDITSAYQMSTPNSWSHMYENNIRFRKLFHMEFIQLLIKMRSYFGENFYSDFNFILKSHLSKLKKSISSPEEKRELMGFVMSNLDLFDILVS